MTPKKRMALKMMTKLERKLHVSPFDSLAWRKRKINREKKVLAKRKAK